MLVTPCFSPTTPWSPFQSGSHPTQEISRSTPRKLILMRSTTASALLNPQVKALVWRISLVHTSLLNTCFTWQPGLRACLLPIYLLAPPVTLPSGFFITALMLERSRDPCVSLVSFFPCALPLAGLIQSHGFKVHTGALISYHPLSSFLTFGFI